MREKTRNKVLSALEKLSWDNSDADSSFNIRLYCESGESFNASMSAAVDEANRNIQGVRIEGQYRKTNESDPVVFARMIEDEGLTVDGAIVVGREHPALNRAVRKLRAEEIPVVCLTTDLPSSRRSIYVGNDQHAAGGVAAMLIGNALPDENSNILVVTSIPFRCQQEREMGFRRVLRSDFPHLRIDERMISDDRPEFTRDQLLAHFETHGLPAAIYNVAGANRGVAEALERVDPIHRTFFVGHELTSHSRNLLERGLMDYVISHDFAQEVGTAARWIKEHLEGADFTPASSQILVHTRYNCGL